jgi:(E)-4-hydroxy-3-methyl-but-2-enyl pyrophosphate reductase
MKIRIAKTAGFCMGVRRAVDLALDLNRQNLPLPIMTYGPLIHNPQTVSLLETRGIHKTNSIENIENGTVIIRAHGISPDEYNFLESKGVHIVDATCPRVTRVQALITKHSRMGDFCVIVGDEDHPEVKGLIGFARAGALSISGPEMIDRVASIPQGRSLLVVAQTTQEPEIFEQVVDILRNEGFKLSIYNTICDSTRKRQAEARELAREADMVIVVGGKGSGNTGRLAKVAAETGITVLHVETADEISVTDLEGINLIGVTAGASTPNWQIRSVIEKLKQIDLASRSGIWPRLRRLLDITIMTYIWAALGGAGLTLVCATMQGAPISAPSVVVSAMFVFSMHLSNRVQERSSALRFNTPEIASFYSRHDVLLASLAGLSALIAIMAAHSIGSISTFLLVGMLVTGILYPAPILEWLKIPNLKWKSLKDIPGSKTPLVALGWAMSAVIIPFFSINSTHEVSGLIVAFVTAALMVFWRTALSDLIDIQGDRIGGRDTIPILFGGRVTEKILNILLILLCFLLFISSMWNWTTSFGYVLLINVLVFKMLFDFYKKGHLVDRLIYEGLIDGNFVFAGVVSLIYRVVA